MKHVSLPIGVTVSRLDATPQLRVFVCSPLAPRAGNSFQDNLELAKRLCRHVTRLGRAPYAPHLLCTQFLNEAEDRELGISIGLRYLAVCDEVWVYPHLGISEGMQREIDAAQALGKRVYTDKFQGLGPR